MSDEQHEHPDALPVFVAPGDDDLQQEDTHPAVWPAVAVSVEGIARVRSLPSRRLTLNNVVVPAGGEPVQIVGRMDQRQSLTLFASVGAVYLFTDKPAAGSTAGFPLPESAAFSAEYTGPVWAVNNAASAAATVGYAFTAVEE